MALARPPMFDCGFAALGPQLHQLASAVDSEAANLQTSQIFKGMSVQSALIARSNTVSQPIPGNATAGFVSWDAEEYSFGSALPFINGIEPTAIQNDENHRHWYYMGWFIRTAGSPANTRWSILTTVNDRDPITNLTTQRNFEKTFLNTNATTGEELLWIEFFMRSGGGDVQTFAFQNSGAPINIGAGRFWAMQLSSQR